MGGLINLALTRGTMSNSNVILNVHFLKKGFFKEIFKIALVQNISYLCLTKKNILSTMRCTFDHNIYNWCNNYVHLLKLLLKHR